MRKARSAIAAATVAALVLVATACYPPSQTPEDQAIPPGGRVVATGPILTEMTIVDALPDLSEILYSENDFLIEPGDPIPYRFWVYNDVTKKTTQIPVGRAESGSAALSPDGHSVVFSSNDPRLQVGPTAANCFYPNYPLADTATVCQELYLYNLDTGQTEQLTGLNGSSELNNETPTFSADGQSINFTTFQGGYFHGGGGGFERLDLATLQVVDALPPAQPTTWDRGSHTVTWDATTATLTSQDKTTGDTSLLWANSDPYSLAAAIDNGRLIVVTTWVTDQKEVWYLINTDTGTVQPVSSQWISQDGSRYAVAQQNVTPDATDRLIIAPLPAPR